MIHVNRTKHITIHIHCRAKVLQPPFPMRRAREFQLCWFLARSTHDRILFFFEIWIVTTSLYLAIPNTWGLSSTGGSRFSFILRHVFLISDMIWEANI